MSDNISHIASEIITQTYKPPQPNIVMQRKAFAINVTVILVALVATLLILLGLTRVGSGQLNRGIDSAINGVQDMFSICENVGTKNFKEFMNYAGGVYDNCMRNNKCESSGCLSMTLDLSPTGVADGLGDGTGDGIYYEVNYAVLGSWNLGMFNNYYITPVPWGSCVQIKSDIYCDSKDALMDKDASWGKNEIDVFNDVKNDDAGGETCKSTTMDPITCGLNLLFGGDPSKFSVADGTKVTIKAKKHDQELLVLETVSGKTVDLKLYLEGGKYADKKDAPLLRCTADGTSGGCTTPWAKCKPLNGISNQCDYFYCNNYPGKCKNIIATCTKGTTEVDVGLQKYPEVSCTYDKTEDCKNSNGVTLFKENPYKISIIGIKSIDGKDQAALRIEDKLAIGRIGMPMNEDKWFKRIVGNNIVGTTNVDDHTLSDISDIDDARLSVVVTNVDKSGSEYIVNLKLGCY